MSPYFLRPLKTLFWCPAECQNQSRAGSNAAVAEPPPPRLCYTEPKLSSFTQRFLNQLQSPTAQPGFFFRQAHQCSTVQVYNNFWKLFFFLLFSTLGSLAFFSRGTSIYDAHCAKYVQKYGTMIKKMQTSQRSQ